MADFKVTCFFTNSQTLYGWSETYYVNAGSYNEAGTDAITMLNARMAMMTVNCRCTWVRISDPTIDRDVLILQALDLGLTRGLIAPPDAPDFCAALVRLSGGPDFFTHLFIRGIPLEIIKGDDWVDVGSFYTAFQAWSAILVNTWELQTTQRIPRASRVPISGISPAAGRGALIATAAPAPAMGKTIRIGGVPNSMAGMNGYKIVTEPGPTADDFYVGGAIPVGSYPGTGAYYVPANFVYNIVIEVHLKRITHRAAGRPFAARRGRRSNRIPLRQ
jgi:hypothetical protein